MAKYLIIVALCILGASLSKAHDGLTEEMKKEFMAVASACLPEVGAAQSDIDDMIATNPAAGKEGKCLRGCVMHKFGLIDADGNLIKDAALKHCKIFVGNDPEMVKKAAQAVEDCATKVVPGDKCESAENYKNCFKDAAKAAGVEHM